MINSQVCPLLFECSLCFQSILIYANRQAEDWCTVKHDTRKATDQNRTADTRRLNRETNEGNEGDTGGATETMIR